MSDPDKSPEPINPIPITRFDRLRMAIDHDLRVRLGLVITIGGFVVFIIGCHPDLIGMDRSPLVGVVQLVIMLVGLMVVCLGGYLSLVALWRGRPLSIAADIGLRLVGTGYVIAFFSAFADVFGLGSHKPPNVPFFGPWQARGVIGGEIVIIVGFFLMLPLFVKLPQPLGNGTASEPEPASQEQPVEVDPVEEESGETV